MTSNFTLTGRSIVAVFAALLMGTTFIAAATAPGMVTAASNTELVA